MCMVLTTRYASKSLNYLIKVPTIHDSHPQSLWLKEPPRFPDIRTPRQPHLHRLPHNHPPRLLLISNTFGNEGGVGQGQRRRGNRTLLYAVRGPIQNGHFGALMSARNLTIYVRTTIRPKVFWLNPSACGLDMLFGQNCPHGRSNIKFLEKYPHNMN